LQNNTEQTPSGKHNFPMHRNGSLPPR